MKQGILLINLGTPDSTRRSDVRRYLRVFLMDKRVVDLPWPIRFILVYLIILPFRIKNTTHAYESIWTAEGSPLRHHGMQLCEKLNQRLGSKAKVALGMRYGNPSIDSALKSLSDCEHITLLPLFPQYSSAATGSALEYALTLIAKQKVIPSFSVIRDFYKDPGFVSDMAEIIKPYMKEHDYILFSYHGLPERHLQQIGCQPVCRQPCPSLIDGSKHTGCYRAQCFDTTRLLVKALNLQPEQYSTAFQSRLGRTPWIAPYTDLVLPELASKGIKRLAIACPSFAADCLETIEEIGIRAKEQWLELGGEQLTLIPCLNAEDRWCETVAKLALPMFL